MIDSDVAVIEYVGFHGVWEVLAYIGPDRSDGVIGQYDTSIYRASELRIRYLIAKT